MNHAGGLPCVFISFRTDDGDAHAAHLDARLRRVLGPGQVFRSSRSIPAGAPFPDVLADGLHRACVTLVLIGKRWLGAHGLSDEDDWVRREVRYSLAAGIPVVPVLLDKAPMPKAGELPPDLQPLAERQYRLLRSRAIEQDLDGIVGAVHAVAPQLAARHLLSTVGALSADPPPSALLRAEHAIVAFHGREAELAALKGWRDQPEQLAVQVVAGAAGQGKTRLAAELCNRSAAEGWFAGPLAADADPHAIAGLGPAGVPVLAVIDDAEEAADRTRALLTALARRPAGAAPARIVLVARSTGPWLDLLTEVSDDTAAAAVLDAEVLTLTGVPALPGVTFEHALRAYAARLGLKVPAEPNVPAEILLLHRPLDIHTAALITLLAQAGPVDRAARPSDDPTVRLLHHERRHWADTAAAFELPDRYRLRLAATVATMTLFGGRHRDRQLAVLGALLWFRQEQDQVVDRYLRWVVRMYPADNAPTGTSAPHALRPDRIGEDHVAHVVIDQPDLVPAAGLVADDEQRHRALTVLGQASARYPDLTEPIRRLIALDPRNLVVNALTLLPALENPRPTVDAVTRLVRESIDTVVVHRVLDSVPATLPECAELVVLTVKRLFATDPGDIVAATASRALAQTLHQAGRSADAVRASANAVAAARRAATAGAAIGPGLLAAVLQTHAASLHAAGDLGGEITALREAAGLILRDLPDGGTAAVTAPHTAAGAHAASGAFADPERRLRTLLPVLVDRLRELGSAEAVEEADDLDLRRSELAERRALRVRDEIVTWALDQRQYPSEAGMPVPGRLPVEDVSEAVADLPTSLDELRRERERLRAELAARLGVTDSSVAGAAVTPEMLRDAARDAGLGAEVAPAVRVRGEPGEERVADAVAVEVTGASWCLFRDPFTQLGWLAARLLRDEFGDYTETDGLQLHLTAQDDPAAMVAELRAHVTDPGQSGGWMRFG